MAPEEIIPMSEWVKAFRKEEAVPAVPAAPVPAVAPTPAAPIVIERVVEKPVEAKPTSLITPEEREELKKIITEAYEVTKKTGEKVYDVLKRKIEEWKRAREAKKLKEVTPTAKVKAVPEKEYVRLVEEEKKVPEKEIKVPKTVRAFLGWEE
jgi:hypothetical protein